MRGLIAISKFNWANEKVFNGLMEFEPGDEFDPIDLRLSRNDLVGMISRGRVYYGEIKTTFAEKLQFHLEVEKEEAEKKLEAKKAEERKAAEALISEKTEEVKEAEKVVEETSKNIEEQQEAIQEILSEEIREDVEKARKYKSDRGLTYLIEKYALEIPEEEDLEIRRELVIDALEAKI